jgi:hypothetical protein
MAVQLPITLRFAATEWNRTLVSQFVLLILVTGLAHAQLSTAVVTGSVRDTSAAVVPAATIKLTNVDTSVARKVQTNSAGSYAFPNVPPGHYGMEISASGFKPQLVTPFTLDVNQTLAMDFTLSVGLVQQSIDVSAQATAIEAATSELGIVVSERQVSDLPLNGRNFTQLLSLTPGATPISVGQNSGGSYTPVTKGAAFIIPAVNGQSNRSNFFMLDGLNNQGAFFNTYAIPPIIDAIQEFKINSHSDAQFGSVTGGIVNVVTKSGTNAFHGTLWEYLRNDAFNARNTFLAAVTPFKQNQFGGSLGGPVLIPKLYNGRNKTFFFIAAEGFTYRQPVQSFFRVPTAADLRGDLSDVPAQVFNPFSTRSDPARPGQFIRDPFPGNQIPASLIDSHAIAFVQAALPSPIVVPGTSVFNAIVSGSQRQNQENYTARVDHTIGVKDYLWFRYSALQQDTTAPSSLSSLLSVTSIPAQNYGASWVHSFNSSLVLQVQYGRAHVAQEPLSVLFQVPNLTQTYGFSDAFAGNYIGNMTLTPSISVPGYWSGGESINPASNLTNIHQFKSDVSTIIGRHSLRFGGEWSSTGYEQYFRIGSVGFANQQTGNPENSAQPGSALASFLLDIPDTATRRNTHNTERPGGVLSVYAQDQWKLSSRLTLNIGLRFDRSFIPPYGSEDTVGQQGGPETGDINFNNGTYIVQQLPPPCSQRGRAPCIPGDGTLPAHVVVSSNGKILQNTNNWGPRIGLAYRLGHNTALRSGFGIFYDNWAAVTQIAQNYVGQWPDVAQNILPNLNVPTAAAPTPSLTGQNPFGSTSSFLPPATPFATNTYFMDPAVKNPYSEQWNLGIEHQFGQRTVISVAYVGSVTHRLDVGGYYNTALKPGPGPVSGRNLYSYIIPMMWDRSVGNGNYNALQIHLANRVMRGLIYQISYTWSKAIDEGASGYFAAEGQSLEDPYNVRGSRSVSAYDIPQLLTGNLTYELPVGKGRLLSTGNRVVDFAVGNWQANAIFTARSGQPYTITASGDIANTGNTNYERADLVGDPSLSHPSTSKWFNTSAFAIPAIYTYGNLGRNTLRRQSFWNLDCSIFRQFPIRERMKLEFRAEAFNIFNTVVYGAPAADISIATSFGHVTSTTNNPRSLQLGAKIIF